MRNTCPMYIPLDWVHRKSSSRDVHRTCIPHQRSSLISFSRPMCRDPFQENQGTRFRLPSLLEIYFTGRLLRAAPKRTFGFLETATFVLSTRLIQSHAPSLLEIYFTGR